MFYKHDMGQTTLVGVYVDDLLVTTTDSAFIGSFHSMMDSLDLKNLGPARKFLGISIGYSLERGYALGQGSTVMKLLVKLKLDEANSVTAPIECE